MKANEFRKMVKTKYPEAIVKIKIVSFSDLARASAQFVTIDKVQFQAGEFAELKNKAKEAGLILH